VNNAEPAVDAAALDSDRTIANVPMAMRIAVVDADDDFESTRI
jgi:hypothetical protein